jgi:hypothetical protein
MFDSEKQKRMNIFGPTNPNCWFGYKGKNKNFLQKIKEPDPWGVINHLGHKEWKYWPTVKEVIKEVPKEFMIK